ncbi:MAG: hypothetical protein KDE58_19070, partial [Caldilineaceae bacterium]|nr:hypothetical protein [Caldilineaceae bacterium]
GGGAEPYIKLEGNSSCSGPTLWRAEDVNDGDTKTVDVKRVLPPRTPGSTVTISINEEDNGLCAFPDGDDYLGTVDADPLRTGDHNDRFDAPPGVDGRGTLHYNVQNNLFQGRLDELRIYERELSPEDVRLLMTGGDRLIYQLDEAPGSSGFRNAGVDATRLVCADNTACPDSGLVGYSGQAVRFNGTANATLQADLGLEYAGNLLTGFWFKPAAVESLIPAATLLGRSAPTDARFGFALHATQRADGTSLRLIPNPVPDGPGTVGGNGGSPYTLNCLAGEALVGIVGTWGEGDPAEETIEEFFGGDSASPSIMSVGPLCVATTPDYRQWSGDPVRRGTVGGGGGGPFDSRCPAGSYVVGFEGTVYDVVGGIKLLCAPAGSPGVLDSEHATKLPAVGYDEGAARPHCPFNLPATGILGRAGDMVDQFGLQCEG